jgi:hypothetical protein
LLSVFLLSGFIHQITDVGKTDIERRSMSDIYENYPGPYFFDHWEHYAQPYDFHLEQTLNKLPKSKTFRMLEIGVQSGGSVEIWKSYFSSRPLYYVGMDIEENCKRSEDVKRNIFIEIGNQKSSEDLLQICQKHGPFDFVVDDGGHTFEMMKISLDTLFPSDLCMTENSLYVIEDMHTMALNIYGKDPTDIPSIPSEVFRKMH